MITVLFACVHNAGRSQMAAALFKRLVDPVRASALSAGTEPATQIHPEVLDAMREIGVDLSAVSPRRLTDRLASSADILVTMGCGERCPVVPGVKRVDWEIPDPKGQPPERVREIRQAIEEHVRRLIATEGLLH